MKHDPLISQDLDDALRAILADIRPVDGSVEVSVSAAAGRYAARAIDAPMNLPPFAASAMDGYALRSTDTHGQPPFRLKVSGTSSAGHPFTGTTPPGSCVRIFTGAVLPEDLDTVVIQENCETDGVEVRVNVPVSRGDNVRPPGHDVAAGSRIIHAGQRLSEFDAGWLSACGIHHLDVVRCPRVGIFSTGDELLDPGTAAQPGKIFDANRLTLALLLRALPVHVEDFGIVADHGPSIQAVLERADAACDVVLTSGGVSVGDADWVKQIVNQIGALRMWKLNLKPGKPLAYGHLRRALFFGLPGNPVSTIVTAIMVVRPVLEQLCGGSPTEPLAVPALLRGELRHEPGREEFQRGTLFHDQGDLHVRVTGDQSSNRLGSFAGANCLIRIPKQCGNIAEGNAVTTLPFRGLL